MSAPRPIRVAAGQSPAGLLESPATAFDVLRRQCERAARARAELLVLPECAYPAYWLGSRAAYFDAVASGRVLPTAAVLDRLSSLAVGARLHLVCGLVEQRDDRLFNSAAVIAPDGRLIGLARKSFLWDCDNRWFTAGDSISTFDTDLGRIGVMICADARAPEIAATLAAGGAELIAMPTAWVSASRTPGVRCNAQPDFLIEARVLEFGLPFVCADKCGDEATMQYVGQSLIAAADGAVRQRAPIDGESLIVDAIAPGRARRAAPNALQAARLRAAPSAHPPLESPHRVRLAVDRGRFEFADARAVRLSGDEARSFVAARCAALDGAQVLCVAGAESSPAEVSLPLLRARAAENRLYVLARGVAAAHAQTSSAASGGAHARLAVIIAPDGSILARGDDGAGLAVDADLSEADRKQYTPETNIWAQRRINAYQC